MSETTLQEEVLVIKWYMLDEDDKLIKFDGKDEPYETTDAVKEFIKSKKISQTAKVKVSVNPKGGEEGKGLVERIEVVEDKKETVKEEAVTETNATENVSTETAFDTKELTVGGVALDKKNIIFKEEENVWYQLADDIDAQNVKDNMTHQTVKVSITKVKGDKDRIDSIKLAETQKSKDTDKKSNTGYESRESSVQASIESQVSVEHACSIVCKTVDKDTDPEVIETRIARLAKHNYDLIQELKKK